MNRLIKHLKLVAFCLKPFDCFGQGVVEFVDTLERVVEGDNGSVASVAFHIVEHVFGSHPFRIVACDKIPHDDAILTSQPYILIPSHPSMRRAEEVGMQQLVGLVGISLIGGDGVSESAYMVEGVVADAMTGSHHLII